MATFSSGLVFRVIPRQWLPAVCCAISLWTGQPVVAQQQYGQFDDYDLAMYDRPNLRSEVPGEVKYADGLATLWARALDRPDAELQRLVIDTLAVAHQRGIDGIDEFEPRLVEIAKSPDTSPDVLRAVVRTLIVFDAKDQASLLAELARKHGVSIGQIVEPALARWQSPVMEEDWLSRVSGPSGATSMVTIAMDGLAALQSEKASEPLQKLVRNIGTPSQLRLAAARALAQLHNTGLVDLARELSAMPSQPDALHPLLAIQLLVRHVDPEAIALFEELLNRDNTAVQSESLANLYRIDFNLVDPYCDQFATSRDSNVRRWCLRTLFDTKRADRVNLICQLLNDVNPNLRRKAADSLIQLARDAGLEETVIEETEKVLARDDWRACEQACVVLTKLDHRPIGRRMVELLGHPRGEVQVAAAWGLTKLRIEELLPDMLDHAQSIYDGFRSGILNDNMPGASLHVAHLFIAFGDQTYQAAEPLMRKYMPKDRSLGYESRAAAAWALGMLHQGDADSELVAICVGRLNDNGIEADDFDLRSMCAISLGRMMAESALPDLRKNASVAMPACYWAIERMTGEKPPEFTYDADVVDDWFLSPIDVRGDRR